MLHPPLNWAALSMICAWTVVGVCEEDTTSAPKTPSAAPEQAFAVCELYAPGHFGNSYEVLGDNEIRSVLSEAKFWGFGRYGDWFDTDDCKDPFAPGHTYGLGGTGAAPARPVGPASAATHLRTPLHSPALVSQLGKSPSHSSRACVRWPIAYAKLAKSVTTPNTPLITLPR